MQRSVIIALILPAIFQCAFAEDNAKARLGKYSCIVEKAYGNTVLPRSFLGSRLEYDADKGILDYSDPAPSKDESLWMPPRRLCNRLFVQTKPSSETQLHAVQFDAVSPGDYRPFVAWLMIETIDNKYTPNFTFFTSGMEGVVTGKCTHSR